MLASSIIIPEKFFESIALSSIYYEKYFEPFSVEVLRNNAHNLRMHYLTVVGTTIGIYDYSLYSQVILGRMDQLEVIRNSIPLDSNDIIAGYSVANYFPQLFSPDIIADLQLVDSFKLGSVTDITQQELWLRD